MRRFVVAVLTVGTLMLAGPQAWAGAGPAGGHPGYPGHPGRPATVEVGGQVGTPASYTPADLAALPQVTLPGRGGAAVTGVSLQALVQLSGPDLDSGKNPQLRVAISVIGRGREVRFALGELDAGFGNHPALLIVRRDRGGPEIDLTVPGDATPFRTVHAVSGITVAVQPAAPASPPSPGAIRLETGRGPVVLSAARLAALPTRTLTVSFQAGTASQTHTETGPTLAAVLRAAGVAPLPNVLVTAIGSDGYGAEVTVGEAIFGGRPLLLSLFEDGVGLPQPRLVPAGDVKGGRYVSALVTLTVGGATRAGGGSGC